MNSNQRTKTINIKTESNTDRVFQLKKFTALKGLQLAKFFLSKLLPIAQDILPQLKSGSPDKIDASILDNIDLEQISSMLENLSDEDLENVAYICLTHVSEYLASGSVDVMNKDSHFYQIEDIEYDPVLFIKLIYEQMKFGLSDFFAGNRWSSILFSENPSVSTKKLKQ